MAPIEPQRTSPMASVVAPDTVPAALRLATAAQLATTALSPSPLPNTVPVFYGVVLVDRVERARQACWFEPFFFVPIVEPVVVLAPAVASISAVQTEVARFAVVDGPITIFDVTLGAAQ